MAILLFLGQSFLANPSGYKSWFHMPFRQVSYQLATYSSCYAPGLCGSDYWYFDDAACWFYYFHDYTCSFSLFMSGTMPQAIGPVNLGFDRCVSDY